MEGPREKGPLSPSILGWGWKRTPLHCINSLMKLPLWPWCPINKCPGEQEGTLSTRGQASAKLRVTACCHGSDSPGTEASW